MKKYSILILLFLITASNLCLANDSDTVWCRWNYDVVNLSWSFDDSTILAFKNMTYPDTNKSVLINFLDGSIKKTITPGFNYGYYSKDGNYILCESRSNIPNIFNSQTFLQKSNFVNPNDESHNFTISPTNKIAAIGSDIATLRVWDIETGEIIKTKQIGMIDTINWIRKKIYFSKYTADSNYILLSVDSVKRKSETSNETILLDTYILVLDANTLETVKIIKDNYGTFNSIIVSKTGKYFATDNNEIRIINIETSEVELILPLTWPSYWIDFSSDDKYVAFTNNAETGHEEIEIWDIINKTKVYSYKRNPQGPYVNIAFSNNDEYLCASTSARLYLYRTNSYLSIEPENPLQATVIYPNPTNDNVNLNFNLITPKQVEITLIDLFGHNIQAIANELLDTGSHTYNINLSSISNGTYFIKLTSGNCVSTHKIIINR